jgi:hypothetical protein
MYSSPVAEWVRMHPIPGAVIGLALPVAVIVAVVWFYKLKRSGRIWW